MAPDAGFGFGGGDGGGGGAGPLGRRGDDNAASPWSYRTAALARRRCHPTPTGQHALTEREGAPRAAFGSAACERDLHASSRRLPRRLGSGTRGGTTPRAAQGQKRSSLESALAGKFEKIAHLFQV